MAETPSAMVPLGTMAPDFNLPDVRQGPTHSPYVQRRDFEGKPLLVMFLCKHCPYVQHIRQSLAQFAKEYQGKGLATVAINANDAERYPDDGPRGMAQEAQDWDYSFPYLYDETQEVAQAYHAACTPDFFIFDRNHALAYRGQFDNSRPGHSHPVTGADLRHAADAVLAGQPVEGDQKPSVGCNIKWKPGNQPVYA